MTRTRSRSSLLLAPLFMASVFHAPVLAQEAGEQPPPAEQPAFSGEMDPPSSGEGVTLQGTPVPALTVPSNPRDLLTGLYATKGLAEICGISIAPDVASAMSADEAEYVASLGITEEAATKAYADIKSTLEERQPDCSEGSGDVAGVTEVLDLYAAEPQGEAAAPAAVPAGTTTPAAPAEPTAPAQPAPQ